MEGEKIIQMKYSDYTTDQIVSPMYEKVAKELLILAKDENTKRKMERHII